VRVLVKTGDVLDESVDALVSTANPHLNMSGGVNGAILLRGGEDVQQELHEHLRQSGKPTVPPGAVVVTGPGPLKAGRILHTVAVDVLYGSSVAVVRDSLTNALTRAAELGARTVATPALATGYGPLAMEEFARGLRGALGREYPPVEELRVVVRNDEDAATVLGVLATD
jgi:O-acetyl-ADP-ribose deacetylase (regulator of RNase III)